MSLANNHLLSEDQRLVPCVYNKVHMVSKFRLPKHHEKCRRSYAGDDIKICRFNLSHHVPESELEFHEKTCSDRSLIEKFVLADALKRKADPQPEDTKLECSSKKVKTETDELTDEEEEQPEPAKLNKPSEANSYKIVHFQHMTKSARKAARMEHHQKQVESHLKRKREEGEIIGK